MSNFSASLPKIAIYLPKEAIHARWQMNKGRKMYQSTLFATGHFSEV
jgi:hypothetical protein